MHLYYTYNIYIVLQIHYERGVKTYVGSGGKVIVVGVNYHPKLGKDFGGREWAALN